jgi:excisionase family DNA binding protein
MAKDSKRPAKYVPRPEETQTLLKAELHRRGMSDAAIAATLRKKKRRKSLEFGIVQSRHTVPRDKIRLAKAAKTAQHTSRARLADELCTVEFAAERLKEHQKTILRFVRKGRLKAARIGKSYRILRSDLEAFAGVALPADAPAAASMTSIVDIPGVAPDAAQTWSKTIMSALNAKTNRSPPLRAEVIYEPERSHLKVVIVGAPADAMSLLGLIRLWIEN